MKAKDKDSIKETSVRKFGGGLYQSPYAQFLDSMVPAILAAKICSEGYIEEGDYHSAIKASAEAWEIIQKESESFRSAIDRARQQGET